MTVDEPAVRWSDIGVAAAIALVATLIPFHRGFSFPFALDDYTFLYDVSGLEPQPFALRRWLAVHGYYATMLKIFGPHVLAWHVVSFVLHCVNAAGLYVLARRFGASRVASWTACGLFAASPLAFTVLYWAAGIQELASSVAILAAAWVLPRTDRWQWAAVPLFAVAMLCKESVIAAPIALAFIYGRRTRPVAAAMLVIGVAIFLGSGLQHRMMNSSLDSPYATAYDKTLFDNLATQLVWFLAPWRSYPDRIAGPNAHFLIYLVGFTGALVALAFIDRRTRQPILWASAWFVALLLPILPLRQHSYAYYSYLPQMGYLILAGVGLEILVRRFFPHPLSTRIAGAAVIAASMVCAARNTRVHETLTLKDSLVPHDSVVRSGTAAGALLDAVRKAKLGPPIDRVGFMSLPAELAKAGRTPGDARPGMVRVRRFPLRDALRDGKLFTLHYPKLQGVWIDSLGAQEESGHTAIFFTSGFNDVIRLADIKQAYFMQSQGKLLVDDRAGARQDLERILVIDPNFAPARVLLAGFAMEAGDVPHAAALLQGVKDTDLPAELRPFLTQLRPIVEGKPPMGATSPAGQPLNPTAPPAPGVSSDSLAP
jgi:hypothetical protein